MKLTITMTEQTTGTVKNDEIICDKEVLKNLQSMKKHGHLISEKVGDNVRQWQIKEIDIRK